MGSFIYVIIAIIIIVSISTAQYRRRQTRDHREPVGSEGLQQRDLYILKLIKEQGITSLSILKEQAHTTDLELNRIIGRLLRSDALPGYYLNYRTRHLELINNQPANQQTIVAPRKDFIAKTMRCAGCGAREYVNSPNQRCSYCNSPFEE